MISRLTYVSALIGTGLLLTACGGTGDSSGEFDSTASGSGGAPGSGGASAGGGTGPIFSGGSNAGGSNAGGSTSGGNGTGGECAGTFEDADRAPAVIEMVIDTSGSMDTQAPGASQSRWQVTKAALEVALDNLAASAPETAIGVSFFPNTAGGGLGSQCYAPSQAVPIAALSAGHLGALKAGFNGVGTPIGGTPTHNAYHFSAGQLLGSPLPGNRFMLLITDGMATFGMPDPNNPGGICSGFGSIEVDVSPLIQEVSKLNSQENVRTFVIGVPGSESFRGKLSEMARLGGTGDPACDSNNPAAPCHFDMTTEPDLSTSLGNALASISNQALSCTYDIPDPPDNQALDLNAVNVFYTPPGGPERSISRDGTGSDCVDGWQYSADKTQVILCGAFCDEVTQKGGNIEIQFGCAQDIN